MTEIVEFRGEYRWEAIWLSILAEYGSRGELAETFGVTRQAVHKWEKQRNIPYNRAKFISERTGIKEDLLCTELSRGPRRQHTG